MLTLVADLVSDEHRIEDASVHLEAIVENIVSCDILQSFLLHGSVQLLVEILDAGLAEDEGRFGCQASRCENM